MISRIACIGIGTNLGDSRRNIQYAIAWMRQQSEIQILRISHVYETKPVGYVDQPLFLNLVLVIRTILQPKELLKLLLFIENKLGRVRTLRWGPRTLDLDLLLMEGIEINTEELVIPHPRMWTRGFVLVPLNDVISSLSSVINKSKFMEYLSRVPNLNEVKRIHLCHTWFKVNEEGEFIC